MKRQTVKCTCIGGMTRLLEGFLRKTWIKCTYWQSWRMFACVRASSLDTQCGMQAPAEINMYLLTTQHTTQQLEELQDVETQIHVLTQGIEKKETTNKSKTTTFFTIAQALRFETHSKNVDIFLLFNKCFCLLTMTIVLLKYRMWQRYKKCLQAELVYR